MARPARYGKPEGAAELRQYALLVAHTFGGDAEAMQNWVRGMGADAVRLLRGRENIDAGLTVFDMGQYFGGRAVPIWGVAGVVIPHHARGQGRAREILTANLAEQFKSGPPLATLYPASVAVYRKLGYEQSGARITARYRAPEIPYAKAALPARPIEAADWPAMRALYAAVRGPQTGCLARNDEMWERVRRVPAGTALQGAIIERDGKAEGYIVFTLARTLGRLRIAMQVRDWCYSTPEAGQTLASMLYGQRSVVDEMTIQMGPAEPMLQALTHDQNSGFIEYMLWMLRVVRVGDALATRGWPEMNATIEFGVIDEQLPKNAGPWRVEISNGSAEVKAIKRAKTKIHVRGLAALYSGFMAPQALRQAGLLKGDAGQDAALAAMFAGPAPWMPDYF